MPNNFLLALKWASFDVSVKCYDDEKVYVPILKILIFLHFRAGRRLKNWQNSDKCPTAFGWPQMAKNQNFNLKSVYNTFLYHPESRNLQIKD